MSVILWFLIHFLLLKVSDFQGSRVRVLDVGSGTGYLVACFARLLEAEEDIDWKVIGKCMETSFGNVS